MPGKRETCIDSKFALSNSVVETPCLQFTLKISGWEPFMPRYRVDLGNRPSTGSVGATPVPNKGGGLQPLHILVMQNYSGGPFLS